MKIRTESRPFAKAVASAAKACARDLRSPLLAGMLLEADGEHLTVSAYDYETTIQVRVPAEVDEPGRVLVSGRLLAAIAKTLSGKPVDLAAGDVGATLECGSTRFVLPTLPDADYPTLPPSPPTVGTVSGSDLRAAVAQAAVAARRGDGQPPELAGLLFQDGGSDKPGYLVLTATDRYRAARAVVPWVAADDGESPGVPLWVLPPAARVKDALAILGDADRVTLAAAVGENAGGVFEVSAPDARVTTVLHDGKYPDLSAYFAAKRLTEVTVDRAEMLAAVQRVIAVSDEEYPRVHLVCGQETIHLNVATKDEAGSADVVAARIEGPDVETTCRGIYLVEALAVMTTGEVEMSYDGGDKPGLLREVDDDGVVVDGNQHLIMPLREV